MAESTLSLTRTDLLNATAFLLGFGVSYSGITDSNKQTLVQRCVDSGLRSFYAPTPLQGERIAHIWSFMQPLMVLPIGASMSCVDLPDDFGGMVGSVYLSSDDSAWRQIRFTGLGQILGLRQAANGSVNGTPQLVATRPMETDGSDGQRFALEVYPTTDAPYSFQFTYYSNPYQLTESKPYPCGGQPHAETLREACLAAVEREVWQDMGIHTAAFKERLAASVALDRRLTGPKSFGMNSDADRFTIANHRLIPFLGRSGYVTYNGQLGDLSS